MRFKPALWDGSDPSYAPCISWSGKYPSWKCPKKYADMGYTPKSIPLQPGSKNDALQADRAFRCREHTKDLERWLSAYDSAPADPKTWQHVIDRYRSDDWSPYQDVKPNTRQGYDYLLERWEKIIGEYAVIDMDFVTIKSIEGAMRKKGYSQSNIRRMFQMLRSLASYAKLLKVAGGVEVKTVLSEMRFKSTPARSEFATREQVQAIVDKADAEGNFGWGTGILMCFEFMLRAVDVRGQWFEIDRDALKNGGITRTTKNTQNGKTRVIHKRWQDGLTWEMFDDDMTGFEKVISKTEKSMPEPYWFDLSALTILRRRLKLMRPENPVGPVFITPRHGLPWDRHAWSNAWRRYADAAGVPSSIQMRDMRAGGNTEASMLGVSGILLRDANQHLQETTTNRYSRARSENANKVVELRQGARK